MSLQFTRQKNQNDKKKIMMYKMKNIKLVLKALLNYINFR